MSESAVPEYEVVDTLEVDVSDVKYVEEVYPRENVNENAVSRYKGALDQLPPIVLAQDKTLIDGYHRLRAHQSEGRDTIDAEITDLEDSQDVYLAAIKANNSHGQQLIEADKKSVAEDLRLNHRMESDEIAEVLGVAEATARGYLTQANNEIREVRRNKVYEYYLDYLTCSSQQAVADRLAEVDGIDCSRQTVDKDLANSDVENKISNPSTHEEAAALSGDDKPGWLKWTNVWNFPTVNKDYGSDYPGRIPGQILQNLLIHFTDQYDLVVDPMAGGGTTVDVCKDMGRRYAAYDMNPLEDKGIRKSDTTNGFTHMEDSEEVELGSGVADLVFSDPPYWNLMDSDYIEGSNSAETYDDWLESMKSVGEEANRVLNSSGRFAVLVMALEDETGDGEFRDLTVDLTDIYRDVGFSVGQRISVPINSEVKSARDVEFAKENRKLLSLNRDLIVYENA